MVLGSGFIFRSRFRTRSSLLLRCGFGFRGPAVGEASAML